MAAINPTHVRAPVLQNISPPTTIISRVVPFPPFTFDIRARESPHRIRPKKCLKAETKNGLNQIRYLLQNWNC